MANESSFYGDITFYHKGLEDTPENRERFKKLSKNSAKYILDIMAILN